MNLEKAVNHNEHDELNELNEKTRAYIAPRRHPMGDYRKP